ncbi:hypothetical protein GCK72_005783 [Caenorhabditis remanei]|uniref:Uncharacterized protein n=1 Tax=Caenorhabditis remanei TaxID=31234 RepID=A0A6A5HDI7_CAERE|nr:hypothetical protein GCK72_005783 [Caenorhabditis remanei]KAF1765830.1 hypothetical protein GCK72_005783 [Caenorhabditis remanei]
MSGGNWQNTWSQQPPQHPQQPQQDMYNQSQPGYGYNQSQARGPPQQQIRQNDYISYQHQRPSGAPNAFNRQPPHQQYQQNYMAQQHLHGYHHQQQPFMFNANANVFVPRNQIMQSHQDYGYYAGPPYQQHNHAQYQQNQFGITSSPSSSYNAMYQQEDAGFEAFAQFGQQSQQYLPSKELADQIQSSKCSSYLTEILVGCEQLIAEDEEESSTWISAIRQRFEDPQMDEESKKIGVKLIIEMAYSMESNQFRSIDPQNTFSNLLKTLSLELKGFLRKFIVPALGEYHESRKQFENDDRVFMAIFYAEVYVKLFLENGSRFERIGEALADQIDEILKFQPKDEYMKSLIRAFKVAGAELDTSESLRRRVDQILTIMGGYAKGSPLLGESVKAQIFSLIECRTRGWDRPATRGPEVAGNVADRDQDSFDESTDNDLTEEERLFLESHLDQVESGRAGEDDFDDQEMMKEFGKFVKEELLQAEELKTAEMLQNCNIKGDDEEKAATEEK